MSWKMSSSVLRQCSECKKMFETRTANTATCGPYCARTRKSKLQKRRRDEKDIKARESATKFFRQHR